MRVEPQFKLMAICALIVMVPPGLLYDMGTQLTGGEGNNVTPLISSCQVGGTVIVQYDIIGRIVLGDGNIQLPETQKRCGETHVRGGISRAIVDK